MSEADGVDEVVAGGLRVAVTAAGVVAERLAQARADRAHELQQDNVAEARHLEAQYRAELAAARGRLSVVEREGWWQAAKVNNVADAWQTARQWRGADPDVDRAADRIRTEVRDRYGVDVTDPAGISSTALDRAVTDREYPAAVSRRRAREVGEELEAVVLVAGNAAETAAARADRAPGAAEAPAPAPSAVHEDHARRGASGAAAVQGQAPAPDLAQPVVTGLRAGRSPEVQARQAQLAETLAGVTDREAVQARMVADLSFPRPASDAVTTPPRNAPKARSARGRGAAPRQSERGIGR